MRQLKKSQCYNIRIKSNLLAELEYSYTYMYKLWFNRLRLIDAKLRYVHVR